MSRVVLCLFALTAVFACVIGVAAASSSSPAPDTSGTILKVGWAAQPNTFNPFRTNLICEWEAVYNNYDFLVGVNAATYEPEARLATSWTESEDGLTWTFKTREGVQWQDGQPFTARDVAFTFNYIRENDLANYNVFTEGIEEVEATDDTTAVFHLKNPSAIMLRMYVPILPEHIWSKIPGKAAASTFQNTDAIGTGPFRVVEFKPGQYIEMVANKDYWRGAPKVDGVIFQTYQNANSLVEELKSGVIDVAFGIPDAQFKQLEADTTSGVTALAGLRKGFEELGFNCYAGSGSLGNPVLKDWKFRQALNWAVDKQEILDTAYFGYGEPATSIIQPGYFTNTPVDYHWEPSATEAYTFDLDKAGEMLTAAGYPLEDGVRLDKRGQPIGELRLYARANSAQSQRAGKLLASWFEQLGLEINYQVLDESALLAKQYNFEGDTYKPDYDMFLWDWVGAGIDPNFILSVFTSGQIGNYSDCQWSNAEYDALFDEQRITTDETERRDLIWEMQKIVYEQSPYIVLVYPRNLLGYNTARWSGWVNSPAGEGSVIYNGESLDTYLFVEPVATTGSESESGNAALIAIVAIVAAIVVIGGVVLLRRRSRAEEE